MRKKYFFFFFLTALAFMLNACLYEPPEPRQISITGISLNRTSLTLNLWTDEDYDYRTAVLTARIIPEQVSQAVVWGSSNTNVARVADGLVVATGEGTAIINAIAKDGGPMAACSVEVVDQAPGPVQGLSLIDSLTLYLGAADQKTLSPVFSPVFVSNETVTWTSSSPTVATVNQNGTVTALAQGIAVITVTSADGGFTDTCTVMVTPLLAQFESIAAFLNAGKTYYKPGFDFGSDPVARGDTASNTSTWTGTNTSQPDFVLNYTYDYNKFGTAGTGNLVPQFEHPKVSGNFVPSRDISAGPYRSHTQLNDAAIAHYAFTGYRQAHPWGVNSLTQAPSDGTGTTRAGQTWTLGINAFTANTNTVQYSGIGVDLGADTYIDTVLIYAGGNIVNTSAFNSEDINAQCPGITLEYMDDTLANTGVFDRLYKANLFNVATDNWNNPALENNWPPPGIPGEPGYPGSPWISAGKIIPNGTSRVYVFHFEEPVSARYLRCSFEQAPAAPPGTGYMGRAFVNSFEVYNTRE